MAKRIVPLILILALLGFSLSGAAGSNQTRILDVRSLSTPEHMAQLVFDLSEPVQYKLFTLQPQDGKPYRVVLDLENTRLVHKLDGRYSGLVQNVRSASRNGDEDLRVVVDLNGPVKTKDLLLGPSGRYGHRLVLTLEDPVNAVYSGARFATNAKPRIPVSKATAPTPKPATKTPLAQHAANPSPVYAGADYNPPPLPRAQQNQTHRPAPAPARTTMPAVRTTPAPVARYNPPPQRRITPPARTVAIKQVQPAPASPRKTVAVARPAAPPQARILPRAHKRRLVIAIDAGHGGIDPGATGPHGIREKDVVLAISRQLAAMINREKGMRAALTRDGDQFLRLRERIERARQLKADVFISLHADALEGNSTLQGASVYMLSQNGASSEAAQWLAQRENRADLLGGASTVSLNDKSDVLASILLDLSQTGTLDASARLGQSVLNALGRVGAVNHRKVQRAAFMVLRSPDIPSILVETAFISNPQEEAKLAQPAQQRRLAAAILSGLKDYFLHHAPPGTLLARK